MAKLKSHRKARITASMYLTLSSITVTLILSISSCTSLIDVQLLASGRCAGLYLKLDLIKCAATQHCAVL